MHAENESAKLPSWQNGLWTFRFIFSPCPYGIVVVVFHFDSGGHDCFTGQPPGKAISVPAAPDVQAELRQIEASVL